MMEQNQKLEILESVLEAVSESMGDITPIVLENFFEQYPDARELFNEKRLEEMMVSQALYCAMVWFKRPMEVKILLRETISHHHGVFKVPGNFFAGLFSALVTVLSTEVLSSESLSTENRELADTTRTVLAELREGLMLTVSEASEA